MEETLPQGFSYTGSSLSEGSVTVDGQTVSFVLLGDTSFTYTVDVPGDEGVYTLSGVLKDANREEMVIGGASQILVGPEPTATPTPTMEPTATANPEPTVAPTSAPEPTEAPAVVPDATLEPVATATSVPEPTASPTRTPAAAAAAAVPSTPETTDTEDASGFGVFGMAVAGVLLLSAGFLAGYLVGSRKSA